MRYSKQSVEGTLRKKDGFDSFVKCMGRGYLFFRIEKSHVFIFREDVGVSYYFAHPILDVQEAMNINEFMKYAIPFLSELVEKNRRDNLLYNPASKQWIK